MFRALEKLVKMREFFFEIKPESKQTSFSLQTFRVSIKIAINAKINATTSPKAKT